MADYILLLDRADLSSFTYSVDAKEHAMCALRNGRARHAAIYLGDTCMWIAEGLGQGRLKVTNFFL